MKQVNLLIIDWLQSQNGKGVKGFTYKQIFKGVNQLEKVSWCSVYVNIRDLKKRGLLVVVSDCIPLKFRLNPERFKVE